MRSLFLNVEAVPYSGDFVINNSGNPLKIADYVNSGISPLAKGRLFTAPCGLGKTKFAPGLICAELGFKSITLITEKIKSVEQAFDWYKAHKLEGISGVTFRAGGVSKSFGDVTKGRQMTLKTINAWIDGPKIVKADELVMIDEAHNVTAGLLGCISVIPSRQLLLVTASPPFSGCLADASTPYPSTLKFVYSVYPDMMLDELKDSKDSGLYICPTNGAVDKAAKIFAGPHHKAVVYRVSGGSIKKLFGSDLSKAKPATMSDIDRSCKAGKTIIAATEVLQESITLPIRVVMDEGMRVRPQYDYFSALIQEPAPDLYAPESLLVPMTAPEMLQVFGRVGRLKSIKDSKAFVAMKKPPLRYSPYSSDSRDQMDRSKLPVISSRKRSEHLAFIEEYIQSFGDSKDRDTQNTVSSMKHFKAGLPKTIYDDKDRIKQLCNFVFEGKKPDQAPVAVVLPPIVAFLAQEEESLELDDYDNELEAFEALEEAKEKLDAFIEEVLEDNESPEDAPTEDAEMSTDEWVIIEKSEYASKSAKNQMRLWARFDYNRRKLALIAALDVPCAQFIATIVEESDDDITPLGEYLVHQDEVKEVSADATFFPEGSVFDSLTGVFDENVEAVYDSMEDFPEAACSSARTREEPVYVRAPGDCWKHFLFMIGKYSGNEVTCADVLKEYQSRQGMELNFDYLVCYQIMPDGDLHIVRAGRFPTRFFTDPVCGPIRDKMMASFDVTMGENPGSDWLKMEQFIGVLGENLTKLVADETNPLSNAIASLRTFTQQEAVDAMIGGEVSNAMNKALEICPWYIKKENQEWATSNGIPFLKDHPETHSHPVHAAVRRYTLIVELPKYLKSDTTLCSAKDEYRQILSNACPNIKVTSNNFIRDAKDLGRYDSVCDKVFDLAPIETPTAVFHESGHFFSPAEVAYMFKKNAKMMIGIFVHEFPLPALFSSVSPKPSLWQHKVEGNTLIYKPEGDSGGAYSQPFDASLLLARTISSDNGMQLLYCQVVASKLNTHVQIITRFPVDVPRNLVIPDYGYMELMKVTRNQYESDPVPREVFTSLIDYAQSMPNLKPRELRAKLRMSLNPEKYWMDENTKKMLVVCVLVIVKYGSIVEDNVDKYYTDFMGMIKYNTIGRLEKWAASKFSRKYVRRWLKLCQEPHPLQTICLSDLRVSAKPSSAYAFDTKFVIGDDCKESWWSSFKLVFRKVMADDLTPWQIELRDGIRVDEVIDPVRIFPTINRFNLATKGSDELKAKWAEIYQSSYVKEKPLIKKRRPPGKDTLLLRRTVKAPKKGSGSESDMLVNYYNADESSETDDSCNLRWLDSKGPTNPIKRIADLFPPYTDDDHASVSSNTGIEGNRSTAEVSSESESIPSKPEDLPELMTSIEEYRAGLESVLTSHLKPEVPLGMTQWKYPSVLPVIPEGVDEPIPRDGVDQKALSGKLEGEITTMMHVTTSTPSAWWDDRYSHSAGLRVNLVPAWPLRSAPRDYPEEDCLPVALAKLLTVLHRKTIEPAAVWMALCTIMPLADEANIDVGLTYKSLDVLAVHFNLLMVVHEDRRAAREAGVRVGKPYHIDLRDNHWDIDIARVMPIRVSYRPTFESRSSKAGAAAIREVSKLALVRWKPFTPSPARAEKFLRCLRTRAVGTLMDNPVNRDELEGWDRFLTAMLKSDKMKARAIEIAVIIGDPGCSKSKPLADKLRQAFLHHIGAFQVAIANKVLREDWATKIGMTEKTKNGRPSPKAMCLTLELALATTASASLLVMDENKYPPGYLELMCLLKPAITNVIFCGDIFQGAWHEPEGDCPLNGDKSTLEMLRPHCDFFVWGSMRFGSALGTLFCTPTKYEHIGGGLRFTDAQVTDWQDLRRVYPESKFTDDMLKDWFSNHTLLEASKASVSANDMLNLMDSQTMSSSQGLTVKLSIVNISMTVVNLIGKEILWVALTRAPRCIIYVTANVEGTNSTRANMRGPLGRLLGYRDSVGLNRHVEPDPTNVIDFRKAMGGMPDGMRIILAFPPHECNNWEQVKHHYQISGYVDGSEIVEIGGAKFYKQLDVVAGEAAHPMVKLRTLGYRTLVDEPVSVTEAEVAPVSLPTSNIRAIQADYLEDVTSKIRERFSRELWSDRYGYSHQAPDEYMWRMDADAVIESMAPKGYWLGDKQRRAMRRLMQEKSPEANPLMFKPLAINLGLLQNSKDQTSFASMIKERVRRSTLILNELEFKNEREYGLNLWASLKTFLMWGEKVPFNVDEFGACTAEFEARRQSRSQALQKASLPRSEPDYGYVLTAKAQLKLKSDEIKDASPLQSIMIANDEYLYKFGGMGVYLLRKLLQNVPDSVYVHAGKSYADMMSWTYNYASNVDGYWESDLTLQDMSMTGAYVTLLECMMRHFEIPDHLVEGYSKYKKTLILNKVLTGIMTFSGEILTWIKNTFGNMARVSLKYDLRPGEPSKWSGDDSLVYRDLAVKPTYKTWQAVDRAVEKVGFYSERGSFCSFIECKGKVFKNPDLMLRKLLAATERGKIDDVINGIFIDWLTIYNLQDRIFDCLIGPGELEAHNILSNVVFNARRKLGANVRLNWAKAKPLDMEKPPEFSGLLGMLQSVAKDLLAMNEPSYVAPAIHYNDDE
jgi:hypothetical protein